MLSKIKQYYIFIKRFLYYGYIGAKHTTDYDAHGIYTLMEAHIRRVKDFMHNPDNTHLLWNSDPENRGMRQLREFHKLCEHKANETVVGENVTNLFKEYRKKDTRKDGSFLISVDLKDKKFYYKLRVARKKDKMLFNSREERFWHLLRNKAHHFWD